MQPYNDANHILKLSRKRQGSLHATSDTVKTTPT